MPVFAALRPFHFETTAIWCVSLICKLYITLVAVLSVYIIVKTVHALVSHFIIGDLLDWLKQMIVYNDVLCIGFGIFLVVIWCEFRKLHTQ
jgi:hypothetical protein